MRNQVERNQRPAGSLGDSGERNELGTSEDEGAMEPAEVGPSEVSGVSQPTENGEAHLSTRRRHEDEPTVQSQRISKTKSRRRRKQRQYKLRLTSSSRSGVGAIHMNHIGPSRERTHPGNTSQPLVLASIDPPSIHHHPSPSMDEKDVVGSSKLSVIIKRSTEGIFTPDDLKQIEIVMVNTGCRAFRQIVSINSDIHGFRIYRSNITDEGRTILVKCANLTTVDIVTECMGDTWRSLGLLVDVLAFMGHPCHISVWYPKLMCGREELLMVMRCNNHDLGFHIDQWVLQTWRPKDRGVYIVLSISEEDGRHLEAIGGKLGIGGRVLPFRVKWRQPRVYSKVPQIWDLVLNPPPLH